MNIVQTYCLLIPHNYGENSCYANLCFLWAIHTFSAKEKDTETGLSYFGSRYYNSDLSIWLSVDPMSDSIPYMTPYNYCKNSPIVMKDPNGEFPFETIWDIANVVYDVGAAVFNHIKGDHAAAKSNWKNLAFDAAAMFIPYVPAGATKAIGFTYKGFKALDKISAGGKTYSRLEDFEKIIPNLSPGERVARIREVGEQVAKHNGWEKMQDSLKSIIVIFIPIKNRAPIFLLTLNMVSLKCWTNEENTKVLLSLMANLKKIQ